MRVSSPSSPNYSGTTQNSSEFDVTSCGKLAATFEYEVEVEYTIRDLKNKVTINCLQTESGVMNMSGKTLLKTT